MIPLLATVTVDREGRRPIVIWAPLFVLWLLGGPLLVLMLPLINATIIAARMDPRAVSALIRLAIAARGLSIDIQSPRALVRVRVH
jgi:hypothetical protein